MLFFGLDWSEKGHQVCIRNAAGACLSTFTVEHALAGFQRIEAERRKLGVPAQECLVALETSHNLVADFLLDHDYGMYIIPPKATSGYRNRQRSSGACTDSSDAALLAGILRTDRESHRPWRANAPLTQQILGQVRLVEILRRAIQRQSNQLRAALLRTYPAALEMFGDLTTLTALQFLAAYPTAREAASLSRADFETFCVQHGYHQRAFIAQRYAQLQEPMPTAHPAAVQAYRSHVCTLAQLLLVQVRAHKQALKEVGGLFQQHPDATLFASLPGAGDLLAPALLAKFGDDRERFPQPGAVQALAGTCPVTRSSGQRTTILYRRSCDREFRRIAQQFALASLRKSGWARMYWEQIRPHSASDAHATRILANRWLAIIWKLWQTRQPYDEAYHLQQRMLRRLPRPADRY